MDESQLSASARRALEAFRDQTTKPLSPSRKDALWRAAVSAAEPPRNQWVLKAFVLCVSCLVGAVVASRFLHPPEVQSAPTARWHREASAITVQLGQLRLQPRPREKLAVVTPHLQAVVREAVALFDVTAGSTVLAVESGEVAWRTARKSGVVKAGERITVKPQPTLAIAASLPAVAGCSPGPGFSKCLAHEAAGSGLAAEAALYALGMSAHERGDFVEAVRVFRGYATRFPSGVFAPEASIALMVDLTQDGRSDEARAEAARFAARFADEPRAEEIARWAEQLP